MTFSSSQQIPLNVDYGESLKTSPRSSSFREEDMELIIEQVVDFKSFAANAYPLSEHFEKQGWMNYFNILNGSTYPLLVKDFWVRAEVYDEFAALAEERNAVSNDKSLKGKTRAEMGLKEFKCTKIRYAVMGVDISIT